MRTGTSRVAIAGCRLHGDAGPDELFPDVDTPLLKSALEEQGIAAASVSWDDGRQHWPDYDAVVIRSTWDSVDRPDEYLAWAREVQAVTVLLNPFAAVATTLDKSFLRALAGAGAGVTLPMTTFVAPGDSWEPPTDEFVVKPTISGGGRETALYRIDDLTEAGRHVDRLLARGLGVIVQEHIHAVHERGEVKLVFLDSTFSHAIRTGPLLRHGTGVLARPWEVSTRVDPIRPSPAELAFAAAALLALEAQVGTRLTYARIDVVSRSNGDVLLMEIEAIDPALFLWASSTAPAQLANAISAQIQ